MTGDDNDDEEDSEDDKQREMRFISKEEGEAIAANDLIKRLNDASWRKALSGAINSQLFCELATFIEKERANGVTIFPKKKTPFRP